MIGSAVLVAFVIVVGAVLWRIQERVVFQPPPPPYVRPSGVRQLELLAEDGQPLFAFLVGDPSKRGIVVAFHGNADLAVWQLPWAEELASRTGQAVLVAEFRGYGGLPGTPTYAGSRLDARAAYVYARDSLDIPSARIAVYGHSLGSAIAAELAREVNPGVLILVAPMTSVRAMAHRVSFAAVPLFWLRLARVHYDTESIVRTLDVPVWVAHGSRDDVIPVKMGRQVFDAAKVRGELLVLDTAGHNDVIEEGGNRYWHWIATALTTGSGS
jgi:fermentation-respiration switch protein FrsA (DUF1100 family)